MGTAEKIDKIEKILFGDDVSGDKGLFYDYIATRKLLKLAIWFVGIFNGGMIAISTIMIKYFIDLSKIIIENQVNIGILMKQ